MFFTTEDRITKDRKITYANFICNIHPQKSETHRVRLTAGGNKIDYPGDPSSPAVSLLNVKIHMNSTIPLAKHNARYMCIDMKNFYLGTPMKYFQYMRNQKKSSPKTYSTSTTSSLTIAISPTWKYAEACMA